MDYFDFINRKLLYMNLYQIKYFLAVVDSGSFSKAAPRVYVTQPTLSAGIKTLEEELGVALFVRDNRQVRLTDAGKTFLPHARAAYQELEVGRNKLTQVQEISTLRLGMLNTIPVEPVARLIRDYRELHPTVVVELSEGSDAHLRQQLTEGDIDALITTLRPTDKSSSALPLFEEQVMLAVWKGHPLANTKQVHLANLHQQPFIDRVDCELWSDLQAKLGKRQVQPHVVYRAVTDEIVMELVAGGLGVSVLPKRKHIHENVVFLPITDFPHSRRIGLKWRTRDRNLQVEQLRLFTQSHTW